MGNDLQPHQQRVVDEHTELNDKIVKLEAFMADPERWTTLLSQEEQALLIRQRIAMKSYRDILELRIAGFNKETPQ